MSATVHSLEDILREAQEAADADIARRDAEDPGWRERDERRLQAEQAKRVREARAAMVDGLGARLSRESRNAIASGELGDGHAVQVVRQWMRDEHRPILILLGGTGCGKTTAAAWGVLRGCAAAEKVHAETSIQLGFRERKHAHAESGDNLARLASSNWSPDVDKFDEILNDHRPLLVDDLGTERDEAKAHRALYELVNARQQLRTIITSNMSPDAFKAFAGERTLSRLAQVGRLVWCRGDDMRRAK